MGNGGLQQLTTSASHPSGLGSCVVTLNDQVRGKRFSSLATYPGDTSQSLGEDFAEGISTMNLVWAEQRELLALLSLLATPGNREGDVGGKVACLVLMAELQAHKEAVSNYPSDDHLGTMKLLQAFGRPVPGPVWPGEVRLVGTVNDDAQHVKASPGGIPGGPVDAPVQVLVLVVLPQGLGSLHAGAPGGTLLMHALLKLEAGLALSMLAGLAHSQVLTPHPGPPSPEHSVRGAGRSSPRHPWHCWYCWYFWDC